MEGFCRVEENPCGPLHKKTAFGASDVAFKYKVDSKQTAPLAGEEMTAEGKGLICIAMLSALLQPYLSVTTMI